MHIFQKNILKSYVLPLLFIFIIPIVGSLFFNYADKKQDAKIFVLIEEMIQKNNQETEDQKNLSLIFF